MFQNKSIENEIVKEDVINKETSKIIKKKKLKINTDVALAKTELKKEKLKKEKK